MATRDRGPDPTLDPGFDAYPDHDAYLDHDAYPDRNAYRDHDADAYADHDPDSDRAREERPESGPRRSWPVVTAIAASALVGAVVLAATTPDPATTTVWQATAQVGATGPAGPSPTASPAGGTSIVLPATYTVPGTPPRPPWPATGQASLRVIGVGSLGETPDQSPVPIASVSKVMTAYLVLRDHPLSTTGGGPTLKVTDAEAAAYPSQVAADESLVKVTAGEVLTERQALEALLLPSADNMALILARWDAGSTAAFLDKMNRTAASLGMTRTHYTDPSGYESTTRSTADDQVLLAAKAIALPAFAQIVAMKSATIPVAGTVHNYNTILGSDGVDGIKTGSTSAAGGCLLFAARHEVAGHTVTIVGASFGQHGATMYGLPQALTASRKLVQSAEQAVRAETPITAGQVVATVSGTTLVAAHTITVIGWPGLTYQIHVRVDPDATAGGGAGTVEVDGPDNSRQTTTLTAR